MPRLLSSREAATWTACFLLVSLLVIFTGFESDDPDSALYAALSARLAGGPPSQWIAPQWWGYWDSQGLFIEHPVGVLLLPTMLGAIGIPGIQAAYVVGVGAGLASLLLIGVLVARITSVPDGRLALVLLQFMPMAFVFRIRANHEYPMLLCLLLVLLGLDSVRQSWKWTWLIAAGVSLALLVKGVFVVLLLLGAGLWIVINPTRAAGSVLRPIGASLVSLAVMVCVALAYDAWYVHATGLTFWVPYWQRQLGPLTIATPLEGGTAILGNLGFYVLRLLWHPAPWSLALLVVAWTRRGEVRTAWPALPVRSRRAIVFALTFAAAATLLLSPASRFAERYGFSANYAVGTTGAIVACYQWPRLRRAIETLSDRVPALPAMIWLALMLLRLALGPWLPRISAT